MGPVLQTALSAKGVDPQGDGFVQVIVDYVYIPNILGLLTKSLKTSFRNQLETLVRWIVSVQGIIRGCHAS